MLGHVFAAIDIGTNSIRLAVVKVEDGHRMTTLSQHREVVRLGEGEFESDKMSPEAIDRGTLVCARFADVARGFGANEIVAFATSAVREAENRDEFIERVRQEADIEVRVISGVEEARLIWQGVSSGMDLAGRKALLIDIGGGSTEVVIGSAVSEYEMLESMKLGAIRLTNRFLDSPDPVSSHLFEQVQGYVRGVANPVTRKAQALGFELAMGSAGTANALGEVVARRTGETSSRGGYTMRYGDLKDAVAMLCKLPLEERRQVPGMDPQRSDIILGGAAILLTLMEMLEIDQLSTVDRGLRDGILLDHLLREDTILEEFKAVSVRRRSITQLARACNYEREHAEHTAFLALRLFDQLGELGAHTYGSTSRELLEYAAILHDIGTFLSHSNHQKHAYYMVRNSDLLGFDDTEIDVIANVALYHRKSVPKKKHANLADLSLIQRKRVSFLAAILRISEGLDRSHLGLVKDISVRMNPNPERCEITLIHTGNCTLEVWGVQNSRDLLEDVLQKPVVFDTLLIASPKPDSVSTLNPV